MKDVDNVKIDVLNANDFLRKIKIFKNFKNGDFKQVIVVNKSLGMAIGKTAAQVAHASVLSLLEANESVAAGWLDNSYPKIVLQVETTSDLLELKKAADKQKIPNALVIDEGRTEVTNGSITCLGIGPFTKEDIDNITGGLRLL